MSALFSNFIAAIPVLIQILSLLLGLLGAGCAPGARVNLAAADAMDALSVEMGAAMAEYHADLGRYDDDRERAALTAFIAGVQSSGGDQARAEADVEEFLAAMQKVRADRDAETQRYVNSREDAAALAEVSTGLRQFAIQASSLDDEMKRYFGDFIKKATAKSKTTTPAAGMKSPTAPGAGMKNFPPSTSAPAASGGAP